jgi:hypothetical protein
MRLHVTVVSCEAGNMFSLNVKQETSQPMHEILSLHFTLLLSKQGMPRLNLLTPRGNLNLQEESSEEESDEDDDAPPAKKAATGVKAAQPTPMEVNLTRAI